MATVITFTTVTAALAEVKARFGDDAAFKIMELFGASNPRRIKNGDYRAVVAACRVKLDQTPAETSIAEAGTANFVNTADRVAEGVTTAAAEIAENAMKLDEALRPAPPPLSPTEHTPESILAVLVNVKTYYGIEAAKEIISQVGHVEMMKDIHPSNYEAVYAAAQAKLQEPRTSAVTVTIPISVILACVNEVTEVGRTAMKGGTTWPAQEKAIANMRAYLSKYGVGVSG